MGIMDYIPQWGGALGNQDVSGMPTDDVTAQLMLKRKLAMADALRQQEAPQGQMVSGHYVAPSWTQQLAGLAGKYVAGQQEREAMQQYGQAQSEKAQKLGDLMKGKTVFETDAEGNQREKTVPYTNEELIGQLSQIDSSYAPKLFDTYLANRYKEKQGHIVPAGGTYIEEGKPIYTAPTKPEKPQAPVVRTMRIGMNDVTQQWNPEKNTWNEIGRGPAFKPEAPDLSVQDLSPAALDMAAETYRTTGVLPATGFGKQGQQLKRAIMNRAGEMNVNAGISPQDASAAALQGKGDVAAYNQLQKQSTMVKSFEKTARSNGDLALQLSEKADRTGSPIINRWLQAGQKSIAGNPDVSAFNAANETFVNEYAKIMSGSMGNTPVSDSARAHAHDMLSTVQTKEQYRSVMNVLRKEMDNRLHGIDSQLEESRKRLHKGSASSNKVINFEDL